MGQLTITRPDQYAYRIRKIQMYLDGSKLYSISNKETKTFEIPDGDHQLYAKMDWCTSRPITINIQQGIEHQFELGSPAQLYYKKRGFFTTTSLLLLFGIIYLSKHLHNDLVCIIPCSILIIADVYIYFIAKPKSPLYYMTIGWRDFLYFKEV